MLSRALLLTATMVVAATALSSCGRGNEAGGAPPHADTMPAPVRSEAPPPPPSPSSGPVDTDETGGAQHHRSDAGPK